MPSSLRRSSPSCRCCSKQSLDHPGIRPSPQPLVLVEVTPLLSSGGDDDDAGDGVGDDDDDASLSRTPSPLSAPLAKLQLMEMCRARGNIRFCPRDDGHSRHLTTMTELLSDDPLRHSGVPCLLRGFFSHHHVVDDDGDNHDSAAVSSAVDVEAVVTGATMVRVLPPLPSGVNITQRRFRGLEASPIVGLSGMVNLAECDPGDGDGDGDGDDYLHSADGAVLSRHDPEVVRSLALRMEAALSVEARIGTTPDAASALKSRNHFGTEMDDELGDFWKRKCGTGSSEADSSSSAADGVPVSLRECPCALIVHGSSSSPSTATTLVDLVVAVARTEARCDAIHVVPGSAALFASRGGGADAALEVLLHSLAMGGAARGGGKRGRKAGRVCIVLDHFETFLPPEPSESGGGNRGGAYLPVLNSMASHLRRLATSLSSAGEFPFPTSEPWGGVGSGSGEGGFVLPVSVCLIGILSRDDNNGGDGIGGGNNGDALSGRRQRGRDPAAHAADALGGAGRFRVPPPPSRKEDETNGLAAESTVTTTTKGEVDLFASVGGNAEAKTALGDALALDPERRRLLSSFGLPPPTGVLLYGPPGTGKTLLAKAVAQTLATGGHGGGGGGMFLSLKASDIIRPEVGNSEKLVAAAFETARRNAPSVVFIDEFQALFGDRDAGGFVSGQLATTLLQCMDDLSRWSDAEFPSGIIGDQQEQQRGSSESPNNDKSNNNGRIVVLGATNAPWMIDRAFLRPGRFDAAVRVGLPDVDERVDILRVHVGSMRLAPSTSASSVAETVEELCRSVARRCHGFSGADLAALCRAAAVRCLSENSTTTKREITERHFGDALDRDLGPSSDAALVARIMAWQP